MRLGLFLLWATILFAAAEPPSLRLGNAVRPSHYTVELKIDPNDETFTGTIEIETVFKQQSSSFWLNGTDLAIESAVLTQAGKPLTLKVQPSGADFIGFESETPIAAGPATLKIAYSGKISSQEVGGVFRQKSGQDWYVYTQFESTDARRAFPCFDEPGFKAPWQLSVHVKQQQWVVSNTPMKAETLEPNGMKKIAFAETQPISSYLVAFAVGPFELVEAGRAGRKQTPLRVIVPRGLKQEAHYAAATTGQLLTLLENYFGSAYPFEKLDMLAVPRFLGAMENPGLITYSQSLLLAKPQDETVAFQRNYAITATHEMAHQWFGDLVTMSWWDDIWLNEAFASWMENKITDQWKPAWDIKVEETMQHADARRMDSLQSARRIRQPIKSNDDIINAFDGITYTKGAAVIAMFERYLGELTFQKGVRQYLARYAHKNASATEFLAAISTAAGRDVAPAFSTFLDQTGAPLIDMNLDCSGAPKVHLKQQLYLRLGSKSSDEPLWRVPICMKYNVGSTSKRQCAVLRSRLEDIPLNTRSCPGWVLGNEGGAGYFWSGESKQMLRTLFEVAPRQLTLSEQVDAIANLQALTQAGRISVADAIDMLPLILRQTDRHVITATLTLLRSFYRIVPEENLPQFEHLLLKTFAARAEALGWEPRQTDSDGDKVLRPDLVSTVADLGRDEKLIAEAKRLAGIFLDNSAVIDGDTASMVLATAARFGDRDFFDRLVTALRKTQDPPARERLLGAITSFRDPALVQAALALSLDPEFDSRDASALLQAGSDEKGRAAAFDFIKEHYPALAEKLPRDVSGSLPGVLSGFCSDERKQEVQSFFVERVAQLPGGPRNLAQTVESIGLCSAYKKAQSPSLVEALRSY